jgi:hypothetical protein
MRGSRRRIEEQLFSVVEAALRDSDIGGGGDRLARRLRLDARSDRRGG